MKGFFFFLCVDIRVAQPLLASKSTPSTACGHFFCAFDDRSATGLKQGQAETELPSDKSVGVRDETSVFSDEGDCDLLTMESPALCDIAALDSSPDTWLCAECTYVNHSGLPTCEMCETPHVMVPEGAVKQAAFPGAPSAPALTAQEPMVVAPARKPTLIPAARGPVDAAVQAKYRANPFLETDPEPLPEAPARTRATLDAKGACLPRVNMDELSACEHTMTGSLTGFVPGKRGALYQSGTSVEAKEQLLCEGPLLKVRGIGQNRRRWFLLTTKKFMYFSEVSLAPCEWGSAV